MPKIDINSAPKSSAMPEMKTAPSKPRYGRSLNATAYHHSGNPKNVTRITSTKKIETPEHIEIKTEAKLFKEAFSNQPPDITKEPKKIKINDFSSEESSGKISDEPYLIDDLDNFEEVEKKEKPDIEIKEKRMPKNPKKKKVEKGLNIFSKTIFLLFVLTETLFLITSLRYLPESYAIIILSVLAIFTFVFAIFTFLNKFKKVKFISIPLEIILTSVLCFASVNIDKFNDFLLAISAKDYQIEEYLVIVKSASEFEKFEDLNNHTISTYTDISENYQKALEEFSKKSTAEKISHTDFSDASFALLNNETDALLLKGSLKSTVEEIINDYNIKNPKNTVAAFNEKNIRVIDTIEIKIKVENKTEDNIDLSTEPFSIFISGIDTYGDISLVSRSDVNMIATVNPKEYKILLTSIPRDYYVQLHGTTGLKDKLTHAGIYGIDMSRQTLEDLFETEIRYFARVNFNSLIKIVDTIGGITIESDMNLQLIADSGRICYYQYGENNVDGECALRFARERYSYADGDNHRIKNQQEVLNAIIKKVSSSKTIISNYSEILSALSDSFETNIPTNQIYKLAQLQLRDMPSWGDNTERITVAGTGAHDFTYSIPSQSLYVMIPDETTVNNAKRKIRETLGLEVEPEPEELAPEEEIIPEE